MQTSRDENKTGNTTDSSSLSVDECDKATRAALEAARNVEVGDYYFESKNFTAASMRYNDAVEQKPADPAIHVRMGRVLEKLNQLPRAIEQYKAVEGLPGPEKWSKEAKDALIRLQRPPGL